MRSIRKTGGAAAGVVPEPIDDRSFLPHASFEGESLTRFLESFRREIEAARALNENLPYKIWIKKHFAVGVNEVTRVLERMPPNYESRISSEEQLQTNCNDSKPTCAYLQAILMASDCNPRWLTKHLPTLAASRNVPIISVKDRKEGSLRLGELIKLKTTIAIGVKAQEISLNRLIEEVLANDKIDSITA
ncbi:uncharacterized protein LOC127247784 [Andrographis paniculata]|uniref:uncharacterized protein LOC127247784 n=1 Tax=Andrographis paniculata TaxID=175694 RepID=UPI0021E838F6|nr:uncharacterized protein LOC127247784 [Andrographis paniculata]